jgi:hypothetical protein
MYIRLNDPFGGLTPSTCGSLGQPLLAQTSDRIIEVSTGNL